MRRLGAVLLVAAACSSDDPPPCEPAYGGAATDEVWLTMLDGEDRATTGASSPVVTAPAAGATLGAAPRITWTSPLSKPHLPPVTGDVYFARIAVPGRACPVARLTTELAWQLDASEWSALRAAAGQPLSLTIVSAYVTENRITEGPFRLAEPRAFTVAP